MHRHRLLSRTPQHSLRRIQGFSLIELMVGMTIGLLTVLIIAQVALVYEGQKRTTTSGSDAQVSGALALQTLQREIQTSGYGLTSGGTVGCTEIHGKRNGVDYLQPMAPVIITDGANGQPDSLRVLSSSGASISLPIRVFGEHRRDDTSFRIDQNTGLGTRQGDLMLAVPTKEIGTTQFAPSWCTLFTVSKDPTNNTIEHKTDAAWPWNQDPTTTAFPGNVDADISYAAGSHLIDLGVLVDHLYDIRDAANGSAARSLRLQTFDSTTGNTTATDLFANIVNLQAVYGRDTNADLQADVWTATPPANAAEWAQVIAIRIALAARSDQPEKDIVTTLAPTWHPDGITPTDLRVDNTPDWQHFRYKIFEVVVPLRNMLWQS
ncbi:prepilin-type N-terminal cleavage/methylation domain-containing protein [Leptothrix ochracea L12]|uniref:Prepilin-type N-terminal cleavage/methylation domain-containing protein n=1 Tax=Leptothrix ochracea L12 TaxID=735332 RepID=I4Z621_9BURK|nr:PilW family protein [Leptothrix ochracea]EIM31663.1 prepilin-type N-terminal cleavage/methylation domain-containing protein [Leptothrix ochracea L12]